LAIAFGFVDVFGFFDAFGVALAGFFFFELTSDLLSQSSL
jgi:hypothetical protein